MVVDINGPGTYRPTDCLDGAGGNNSIPQGPVIPCQSTQVPMAVIGLACRLPDECHTPEAFWEFIERGGIGKTRPPDSRFNIETHVSIFSSSQCEH